MGISSLEDWGYNETSGAKFDCPSDYQLLQKEISMCQFLNTLFWKYTQKEPENYFQVQYFIKKESPALMLLCKYDLA